MLHHLIFGCVQRRVAVLVLTLVVAAFGVHAYLHTPIEAFPDVTNVQITVIAQSPGLAPEEVERQITAPLERALNGTPGMLVLRSESLFGLALVTLTFDDDADTFQARTLVSERISTAELPDGVIPALAPDATPLGEIYQFRVASDRHTPEELRAALEWTITRVLRQVPGVADVVSFGGYLKELHVTVDPSRLVAHDLSIGDVTEALERSNKNVSGGFLRRGDQELTIRSVGFLSSAEDVKNVVLRSEGGTPVTVGDVARVVQSHTPRRGTVGMDLEPEIVEGFVLLRRGENPSDVLDGVHAKVDELNTKILPGGMRIEPFYDRSTLVNHTLSTVHHNLLHGAALIVGVVWLFLRSLKGSLVVAVVIPLSLLSAFAGLYMLGLPANLISMGAIDFGILVDGAVILVENVMHEASERRPQTKREMLSLVARSALDVSRPTFYAMAIIIAALIPVFTLQRVEGRIFRPLAMTYSFALTGALVFALTVVPALCALLLRAKDADVREPALLARLRGAYGRGLGSLMRHPAASAAAALALVLAAAASMSRVGTEFLPELDEGDVVVFVEMPPSISLEAGQQIALEVRRRLLAFPEVASTLSEQGRPEDGTDNEGANMSETFVRFKPREAWRPGWDKERLIEAMRASVSEIPGVRFNFSQPIKDNVEESVSGVRGKVVLKIFGTDLEMMRGTLEDAIKALRDVRGVVDLDLYRDTTVPQLQIRLDRSALAREGISVDAAQDVIETALAGKIVTELWEGEKPVPVRVVLPADERSDAARIGDIALSSAGGRVPLRDVATIALGVGRASINREANSRYMALKFNVEGRDMGSTIKEAMAVVEQRIKPPEGHFFVWGGEFENQERAMGRLKLIVPISLLVVLGLLYSALGSARAAAAVLLVAPFAMTGGIFAVHLGKITLSVSAAIGFIALLGQVSLAGLLVVSAIDAQRHAGKDPAEAALCGALQRFRALLMTALLAILGLLPMIVSSGVGSETQRPFATVIVGGMVTTVLVVLFLLPILYRFMMPAALTVPEELEAPA
ncbi:efflux RND transporter permease subunit [Sorangium sp. So ce513]|uniref:efflux RND transporter permease subunit n=1 Tax=Sorangium sp. So ce513 TaxID=3133315 RepID=UPI003F6419E8